MSPVLASVILGFMIAVGISVMIVRRTRSYALQIVLALVLLFPAAFCVFGFVATFEPMDAVRQWTFRITYIVLGLGLAATILALFIRRPAQPVRGGSA